MVSEAEYSQISPLGQRSKVKLLLVILFLDGAHLHSEDLLHFGRKRFLHVLLDAAQQEGLQLLVQARVAGVTAFTVRLVEQLPGVEPGGAGGGAQHRSTRRTGKRTTFLV